MGGMVGDSLMRSGDRARASASRPTAPSTDTLPRLADQDGQDRSPSSGNMAINNLPTRTNKEDSPNWRNGKPQATKPADLHFFSYFFHEMQ